MAHGKICYVETAGAGCTRVGRLLFEDFRPDCPHAVVTENLAFDDSTGTSAGPWIRSD